MSDKVFRRHHELAWVEDDGDWFVARIPEGPIHWLQGPAALIWDELMLEPGAAHGSTPLVERVAARVNLEPEDVRPDVEAFLDRLAQLGLLEPVSPEAR